LNKAIFDPEVVSSVFTFVFTFAFLSVSIYVGSIMGLSLFIHDISDNLGLHVVKNFFTGKYHSPKEENRIFMFLDMQSSTSIAEQLGHVVYFRFLKTYYKDIAHSIIRTSGEIYQYVGDEIIVSWITKKGLHRNNCIRCFFLIKQTMEKLAPIYAEQYGIVPGFKAGIHFGPVTTGEIGRIKKEIVFSGDVLNTTARIQGLCNKFEVDNLISGELNALLNIDDEYEISSKGKSNLRGRNTSVELFSLSEK